MKPKRTRKPTSLLTLINRTYRKLLAVEEQVNPPFITGHIQWVVGQFERDIRADMRAMLQEADKHAADFASRIEALHQSINILQSNQAHIAGRLDLLINGSEESLEDNLRETPKHDDLAATPYNWESS